MTISLNETRLSTILSLMFYLMTKFSIMLKNLGSFSSVFTLKLIID